MQQSTGREGVWRGGVWSGAEGGIGAFLQLDEFVLSMGGDGVSSPVNIAIGLMFLRLFVAESTH